MKQSVLCIDDDPHIVDAITRLLRQSGYDVFSSSLESATMELIEMGKPRAIILDISMPSKSGLKILSELRALSRFDHVPVVIVSGRDDPTTQRRAYALGASDFISKPFDPAELVERIRQSIDEFEASS